MPTPIDLEKRAIRLSAFLALSVADGEKARKIYDFSFLCSCPSLSVAGLANATHRESKQDVSAYSIV
jgi:hypothetical protein